MEMKAARIDGKALADSLCLDIGGRVSALTAHGMIPKLAVILAGDDPASAIYVRNKRKRGVALGIEVEVHEFSNDVPQDELMQLIDRLNADESVHGIIIQMPLPAGLDSARLLACVRPDKDVDGIHPASLGALASGTPGFTACTPKGVVKLIKSTGIEIEGKHAVVVGRSCLVGKPAALALLRENATVTLCHSKTQNLGSITKRADILVCAVGKPGLITGDMVKPGAVVIDVGMNRVNDSWCGDVEQGVWEVAGHLTPVPGGVGPMTVTMLMDNTVEAAEGKLNG